jgi:hypothetical protein
MTPNIQLDYVEFNYERKKLGNYKFEIKSIILANCVINNLELLLLEIKAKEQIETLELYIDEDCEYVDLSQVLFWSDIRYWEKLQNFTLSALSNSKKNLFKHTNVMTLIKMMPPSV